MRKISAIIPVYNEEAIIESCLNHLEPYIDEIIIIDGSPSGPSTDRTAEIAKGHEKVKYISGTYRTIPGAWDAGSQKNHGIAEASGDAFLFLSADMFFNNPEFLFDAIRSEEEAKVFFCITVEFWLDYQHVRMYASIDNLSLPGSPLEAIAIARESQPVAGQHGQLEVIPMKPKDQMLVANTVKYHLGWIRPFNEQVEKHLRHIHQGRWGDTGTNLLKGTEQKLEQWAILHVLSYKTVPSVSMKCEIPEDWDFIRSMNYLNGQELVINEYKLKHGTTPFRGVK